VAGALSVEDKIGRPADDSAGAHDGDDLFDLRGIGGIAQPLVVRRSTGVESPASSPAIGVDQRDRAAAVT